MALTGLPINCSQHPTRVVSRAEVCPECGRKYIHLVEVQALREVIDDLWGCIGHNEMQDLQPETVAAATEVHRQLWHDGT